MFKALLAVVRAHRLLQHGGFERLRPYVKVPLRRPPSSAASDVWRMHAAVQSACTLFFKRSTCMHRSAALVRLLRRAGIDARMVFGVRVEPYRGHAWVELDGVAIGEDPESLSPYTVVARM